MRTSEERFRALIDKGGDVITVTDRAGVVTYASPSVEAVTGYTAEAFRGRDPFGAGDITGPKNSTSPTWITGVPTS